MGDYLLSKIIDQLSVDEAINAVSIDLLTFGNHSLPFGLFNGRNLIRGLSLNCGAKDFDFIVIHGSVCHENLRFLYLVRTR